MGVPLHFDRATPSNRSRQPTVAGDSMLAPASVTERRNGRNVLWIPDPVRELRPGFHLSLVPLLLSAEAMCENTASGASGEPCPDATPSAHLSRAIRRLFRYRPIILGR